ncbi:hypothetical protein Rmf_01420 [Roseomonas fluvialis]|uniref:DUF4440 domain-containing protein n=2 Tax=Roseomonas fluvialis TaxID=1750527 RepID=A0ABM7XXJ9_9PROT|nr:hypothetical protein Rmf_01420 [Roseomonas fluvialis]
MTAFELPRRVPRLARLVAVAWLAAGSGVATAAPTPSAFVRQFQEALEARDVERVLDLYAEDGVVLTPQGGVLAGRGSIRETLARNLAAGQPPLRLMNANLDGDSDRGVLTWVWHVDAAPQDAHSRGRRVLSMVYLRRVGGAWRIVAETAQIFAPPPE